MVLLQIEHEKKIVGMWIGNNVTRLGNFLKPLATISLPKSLTFLCNFCKGVKIYHFSSEIMFGQLLQTFGDFYLVTLAITVPLVTAAEIL